MNIIKYYQMAGRILIMPSNDLLRNWAYLRIQSIFIILNEIE